MQADLASAGEDRLDQSRPKPLVGVGRRAVRRMAVAGHEEERRPREPGPLDPHDPLERPVRVGASELVRGDARQRPRLTQGGAAPAGPGMALQARGGPAHADPRPAPGRVDVVGERDREARSRPAWRFDPEPGTEALERRVERVEARRGRRESPVPVPRRAALLEAREVEERLGEIVADRTLASVDPLPGLRPVGHVVAEAELARPERVEHPPGLPLDIRWDHRSPPRRAPLRTRAVCTNAGTGSSRASTASTYGGR